MTNKFMAYIGDDPIDSKRLIACDTAECAAIAARRFAEMGEIITIIGPRSGRTYWKAVGGGGVWKARTTA